MTDNPQMIAGAALLAFAAWTLWPKVRGLLGKVRASIPAVTPEPPEPESEESIAVADFKSYLRCVARAERNGSSEAAGYLNAAMPLLFGTNPQKVDVPKPLEPF